MRGLEKVGGVFALLLGVLFVLLLVFQFVIRPSQGIASPQDTGDPAKYLPAVVASPILLMIFLLQVGFAIALLATALGLEERLRAEGSGLARLATAAATVGAALFLATGMAGWLGVPVVAGLYAQNPALAGPAFVGGSAIAAGLAQGAIFATGWWALLANWTAARSAALPAPLAYLGLLFGAAGVLAFLLPPLSLLGAVLGIAWSLWLGVVLLRAGRRPASAATPAASA